jgi:phytoene dehydrogenase-like protein
MMGTKSGTELHNLWLNVGALDDSVEIVLHEYFFRYELNGRTLTMYRNADRLEEHLLALSPAEADINHTTCRDIRKFAGMDMPISKPMDMYNAIDGIKMAAKYGSLLPLMNKYNKITVGEYVNQFQHEFLREAFKALIPAPYTAMALLSTLGSLHNGDSGWPMGGSLALSKRMAKHVMDAGGRIHYKSPVEHILIEDGQAVGLTLKNGEEVRGDYVISAADGYHTLYQLLDGKYTSEVYEKLYTDRETYPLDCSVLVFLGVNADLSDSPQSIFIRPKQPIIVADQAHDVMMIKHYGYDPSMAKEGKSVICTNFNTDFDWWQQKHTDEAAYQQAKTKVAAAAQAAIEAYYPEIRGKVEVVDVTTPMTNVRYCNAYR